jgi:hypothetical protein
MSRRAREAPRKRSTPSWFQIGRSSAAAFARNEDWLFRRVETIEFVGRHSVRRSISVDFEVPKKLPDLGERAAKGAVLVPISVFHKWPPLMDLSFTGPTGDPVSRYVRTTNDRLNFGLLLGMADRALALGESRDKRAAWEMQRELARKRGRPEPERLSPSLRRALSAVVQTPHPSQAAVAHVVNGLRAELHDVLDLELSRGKQEIATRIAVTVDLAARLANSSILWVAVDGAPGTDRIVKFSYLDAYRARAPKSADEETVDDEGKGGRSIATEAWWRRVLISCSWRRRRVFIPLPHAGRHVRFHLDVCAPQAGVELVTADAWAYPPVPGAEDIGGDAVVRPVEYFARRLRGLDVPDELVGPESSRFYLDYGDPKRLASATEPSGGEAQPAIEQDAHAEIVDRRAHVYLGMKSAPSHRVFLQVKLAASRGGFIRGCMFAAIMIAAVMALVYAGLSSVAHHLEPTVVLLSVVPVVLGYILVRPGEDALERHHIGGVRWMAVLSGVTPIAGALSLVLTHEGGGDYPPNLHMVREIWRCLLLVNILTVAGLIGSTVGAASLKGARQRRGRLWRRAWGLLHRTR